MPLNSPAARRATLSVYAAIVAAGAIIVLAFGPALAARQYGYTWSLLIWLAPNLAILLWPSFATAASTAAALMIKNFLKIS